MRSTTVEACPGVVTRSASPSSAARCPFSPQHDCLCGRASRGRPPGGTGGTTHADVDDRRPQGCPVVGGNAETRREPSRVASERCMGASFLHSGDQSVPADRTRPQASCCRLAGTTRKREARVDTRGRWRYSLSRGVRRPQPGATNVLVPDIVYNSFHGRYSDSPRAVFERLAGRRALDHVWLIDPAMQPGSRRRPTRRPCAPGGDAGAWSRRLSSRTPTPRSSGPSRRDDVRPDLARHPAEADPLRRRCGRERASRPAGPDVAPVGRCWSRRTPQHPRFRRGFRYDGEVLETGYPRNDVLTPPTATRGAATRRDARAPGGPPRGPLRAHVARRPSGGGRYDLALDLDVDGAAARPATVLLVGRTPRDRRPGRPTRLRVATSRTTRTCATSTSPPTSWSPTTPRSMFDFAFTGQADRALHLRPRALPRRPARLLLRLRARRAGSARVDRPTSSAAGAAARSERSPTRMRRSGRSSAPLEDGHATDRLLSRLGL